MTNSQCDFFLLQYVPDTVKNEFVNIAVVLRSSSSAEIRFTTDYSRLFRIESDADLDYMASLEKDLRSILGNVSEQNATLFKKLTESFSNTIQFSPVKGILAADPGAEADKLAQIYLETSQQMKPHRGSRISVRQRLCAQMTNIFVQAGVWDTLIKDIEARDYTHPGDPLKLDCGYIHQNGSRKAKLFHAVGIESGPDAAKSLAFTWPAMRDGIQKLEGVRSAALTVIVDDGLDRNDDRIEFGLSTLARSGIKVAPLAEMPYLADLARRELGL